MSERANLIRGVVKNGVVVLPAGTALPEGTTVEMTVLPLAFTPEEAAEFAGWEKLGDEAWAMIDEWEREGGNESR